MQQINNDGKISIEWATDETFKRAGIYWIERAYHIISSKKCKLMESEFYDNQLIKFEELIKMDGEIVYSDGYKSLLPEKTKMQVIGHYRGMYFWSSIRDDLSKPIFG